MTDRSNSAILFSDLMHVRATLGLSTEAKYVQDYLHASAAGTVEIFRNDRGATVGYMIWAGMVRESTLRFLRQGIGPGYPYEWREGRICVVIEICTISSEWRETGRSLRNFFRRQRAIVFVRKNKPSMYLRHTVKWNKNEPGKH